MAETKVKDAIKEKLNIEVDIERAHRVERRTFNFQLYFIRRLVTIDWPAK